MRLSTFTLSAMAVIPVGLLGVDILEPHSDLGDAFAVNVLAGGLDHPMGLEIVVDDPKLAGKVLVSASASDCIRMVSEDGSVSTLCDTLGAFPVGLHGPEGDFGDYVYIANAMAGGIERVDEHGDSKVFALGGMGIADIHFAALRPGHLEDVDLYALEWSSGIVWRVDHSGAATIFSTLPLGARPQHRGFKLDASVSGPFGRYLYVTEMATGDVWRIHPNGTPACFACTGTPGLEGMAFSPGGAFGKFLYVGNSATGGILRVAPDGTVTPWTAIFDGVADIEFTPDGRMLVADGIKNVFVIEP